MSKILNKIFEPILGKSFSYNVKDQLRIAVALKCHNFVKKNPNSPLDNVTIESFYTSVEDMDLFDARKFVHQNINNQVINLFNNLYNLEENEKNKNNLPSSNKNYYKNLVKDLPYYLEVKKSKQPGGGRGLFLRLKNPEEKITPGTLLALYPGLVHLKDDLLNQNYIEKLLPDPNLYMICRVDECMIDPRPTHIHQLPYEITPEELSNPSSSIYDLDSLIKINKKMKGKFTPDIFLALENNNNDNNNDNNNNDKTLDNSLENIENSNEYFSNTRLNPFALGHYINHCNRNKPNSLQVTFDFPDDVFKTTKKIKKVEEEIEQSFPTHLKPYIPNEYAQNSLSFLNKLTNYGVHRKGLIILSSAFISDDEEILMDYKLSPADNKNSYPRWYQIYDEEDAKLRWKTMGKYHI